MTTLDRLATALAGRYRIERELGAGGMATVYLAADLKHDRTVAIKVLKPELAQSLTGERFLREIAITARLNHPHILALLDSGADQDAALLYYVMPVAPGESVRDRLARDGALPIPEALRVAMDVAEALVHAHAQGVVHRDIKPANVLLSAGHAIVADFGIAKAVGQARESETLTREGMSLGTPAYMAPEQAAGDVNADHRADIYAVGAMLFEMVSGEPPFAGSWQQVVMEKVAKDAPSLSSRTPAAPRELGQLVARCLARDPAARPETADALLAELRTLAAPATKPRSRMVLVAGGLGVAAIAVLSVLFMRDRRARWVHETALPEITRLYEAEQLDSAFALASLAEQRAPGDSALALVWLELSRLQEFHSEPPGAVVRRAPLNDTTAWTPVGTTPTPPVRIPDNAWLYRYALPGYRTVTIMGAQLGGMYVPIPSPVLLQRETDPDSAMVLLRGGMLKSTLFGAITDAFELSDFLMDRLEVTNREYKTFVDAGGYAKREWWDSTIVQAGRPVAWEAAVSGFTDQTGRPGPSTWEGGAPPAGTDDLPVGGVSWHEARAYARFVGKELPTLVEWTAAAIPEAARWVVPQGRYDEAGPVRGGGVLGASPRGVYDLAGNVREWVVNAREPGTRYILGGGWSDPPYMFTESYAQPEVNRAAINGIRLVKRLGDAPGLAAASAPVLRRRRDYAGAQPVDDATFRGFLSLYEYDRTALDATVASRDTTAEDWIREDITFPLAGDPEPMWAVLFLPRRTRPPFQTVVLWPASDAFNRSDRQHLSMTFVDYIVRSGRAVLYPIYEHTYGRGSVMGQDVGSPTIAHRDQMLRWVREMRRSIDYAVTRPEVDSTRLAYVGTSWGGRTAGVALAVEPRFKAAVLNAPGLSPYDLRPEEDAVNFLPRITIPVIMLSGRLDSTFPLETSQLPMYRLLGTPAADKKHLLWDGGHFLPRTMMVAQCLTWLDRYLGPVTR